MKSKIISLGFTLVAFFSFAFADSGILATSSIYSTYDQCNQHRIENQKLYPSYFRSNCFKTEGGYAYNICSAGSSCNVGNTEKKGSNVNTQSIESFSSVCNITGYNFNQNVKNLLDNYIQKVDNRISNYNELVGGFYLDYISYLLGKLQTLPKYKDNQIILNVIGYLKSVLSCQAKQLLANQNKDNSEELVKEFLAQLNGEKTNSSDSNVDLKKAIDQFILLLKEKGIKPNIIQNYVENSKLLSKETKSLFVEELKKEEQAVKKEIKEIKNPTYKGLSLWVGANSYALVLCKQKYGSGVTSAYVVAVPVTDITGKGKRYYYYNPKYGYKLSSYKLGDPRLLGGGGQYVVELLCGIGYTQSELLKIGIKKVRDYTEKIKDYLKSQQKNKIEYEWKKVCTISNPKFSNVSGTYIRDKSNLRDWHRWDYCNGLKRDYTKRKVVANGKTRIIYVYVPKNN